MGDIKQNNKNLNYPVALAGKVQHSLIKKSEMNGNLPLPILLKIKKGIFYIPSLYTITDGVSAGLREAFPNLDQFNNKKIYKVILKKNNMTDLRLSNILKGV